jgi:RNA polymerase sigma-70 factor (ECF subfamily)
MNDHDSAEEVVQDLFYRIWEKREELSITSAVRPYLVKAVYYNSINLKTNRQKSISLDERYFESDEGSSNAEDLIKLEELQQVVESCLDELPDKGRKIFTMSRFEGLKYREIAEQLSVSVKTVEAYMGQALKIFRKNMGEYMGN